MGSFSRNKGKRAERGVIEVLQPVVNDVFASYGVDPPVLKRNTLQSDEGGEDLSGLDWLALEVKHHETLNVRAWWAQTLEQAGQTKEPVLFYKRNNVKWSVKYRARVALAGQETITQDPVVDLEDFLVYFRRRLAVYLERQGYEVISRAEG